MSRLMGLNGAMDNIINIMILNNFIMFLGVGKSDRLLDGNNQ